ncbi:hypothetical protein R3P38DRAFT_2961124 [Favolaschia claudopus]|uniref:Uncharacterized protein n=1 Tax=Favolaschia claudopus TaxID=2862362 RepID=A0AAW0BA24_9AGAR
MLPRCFYFDHTPQYDLLRSSSSALSTPPRNHTFLALSRSLRLRSQYPLASTLGRPPTPPLFALPVPTCTTSIPTCVYLFPLLPVFPFLSFGPLAFPLPSTPCLHLDFRSHGGGFLFGSSYLTHLDLMSIIMVYSLLLKHQIPADSNAEIWRKYQIQHLSRCPCL